MRDKEKKKLRWGFYALCIIHYALALILTGCTTLEGIRGKGTVVDIPKDRSELPPHLYKMTQRNAYSFRFTKEVANWSRELTRDLTITVLHPSAAGGITCRFDFGAETQEPGSGSGRSYIEYLGRRVGVNLSDQHEELSGATLEEGIDGLGNWTRENARQAATSTPRAVREYREAITDLITAIMIPLPTENLTTAYHWQTQTDLPVDSPENDFQGTIDRSMGVDSVTNAGAMRLAYISYSVKVKGSLREAIVEGQSSGPQVTGVDGQGKGVLVLDAVSGLPIRADGNIAWKYTVSAPGRNDDPQWDGQCTHQHSFTIVMTQ